MNEIIKDRSGRTRIMDCAVAKFMGYEVGVYEGWRGLPGKTFVCRKSAQGLDFELPNFDSDMTWAIRAFEHLAELMANRGEGHLTIGKSSDHGGYPGTTTHWTIWNETWSEGLDDWHHEVYIEVGKNTPLQEAICLAIKKYQGVP